jgi:hypothetical protein
MVQITVYVDNAFIKAKVGSMRPAIWCHMTADTKAELHEFAEQLGLKRAWFQDPVQQGKARKGSPAAGHWHYDVTKSVRSRAVNMGAVEIGTDLEAFEKVWHAPGREGIYS